VIDSPAGALRLAARCAARLLLAVAALAPPVQAQDGATAHGTPGKAAKEAKSSATAAPTARRQKELQAEQRELKARLAQLKKSLASNESAHSEAADALAASESAISAANRHLQQLAAARHQVEQRLGELQTGQREAAAAQGMQTSRVGATLLEELTLAHEPVLQSIVDPAQWQTDQRTGVYLDAIVRERMQRIGQLHEQRAELAARETEMVQRRAELEKIDADERSSRAQLLRQETTRRTTLARLAQQIAQQRQSVASLERDDARLGTVIDQIGKVLAEQARRRAQARAKSHGGKGEEVVPAPGAEDKFQPPSSTRFGRLRGKLILPVQGTIGSRYGAARLGEDGKAQAGAPAWKGLFIRADAGTPVHAVAAGQVVFADWLRGFGNLLILDHGEGFLSVYANNETLLHGVGDAVAADEVIASVGNTGGNAQSGLYFEMRYQGRPFDPLSWAAAR